MKYGKKVYFIGIITTIIILGGVFYWFKWEKNSNPDQGGSARIAILEKDSRYATAVSDLKKIRAEDIMPDEKVLYYIRLGLAWKTVAEISRDNQDFMYAADAYKKAVEYSDGKNIVPIVNVGVIYEIIGDYSQAEKYYLQARSVNIAEYDPTKRLVDLYTYKIDRDPKEVVVLIDESLKLTVEKGLFLQLKAVYLKEKGLYEQALEVYQIMEKDFPQVKSNINDLRLQINAQ